MADDILGHENLDHGKHLKHHAHKPEPGERFGRGSKPRHIGLGHKKNHTKHAHNSHTHDAHSHGSNAHNVHGAHSPEAHKPRAVSSSRKYLFLAAGVISVFVFAFVYRTYPAFASLGLILALNTLIELHKHFTDGIPLDIELLFLGSAYLSAVYGYGWGLALAFTGSFIADGARGHIHSSTTVKAVAVMVTATAAAILNPTTAELVFAILLGNIAQYLILFTMGRTSGIMSVIRRLTTVGFNSYLAIFVVPLLLTAST